MRRYRCRVCKVLSLPEFLIYEPGKRKWICGECLGKELADDTMVKVRAKIEAEREAGR